MMPTLRARAVWSAIAALVAISVASTWGWFHAHKFVRCTNSETTVGGGVNGRDLVIVSELCNGIAGSDEVSIELLDPSGARTPILQYGAAYSFVKDSSEATPVVAWKDKDTVVISVKKVAYLTRQVEQVDSIRVEVAIGEVLMK